VAEEIALLTAALEESADSVVEPVESAEPVAVATLAAVPVAASVPVRAVAEASTIKALVAQALTLLGRLLYQAGRVPASMSDMIEEREAGSMISFHQVAGMAVSMTVRIELGTESRRARSASSDEDEEVPVAWGAARAVAEKRRAARILNCMLEVGIK
jgi:hypothetical protein